MEPEEIVTERDFFSHIQRLAESAQTYQGTLEAYLSSVLRLVTDHEHDAPTARLIARILTDALIVEPLPFDSGWLAYTKPPTELVEDDWIGMNTVEAVKDMLRFQIADLRRLDATGEIHKPYSVLGLISPTGHSWYNFNPAAFLDCAIGPFSSGYDLDSRLEDTEPADDTGWAVFVWLLRAGQEYE